MEAFLTLTNSSNILVDVGFAAVFLIIAIIDAKRGFCKCIMPIVVFVVSLIAAIFLSNYLQGPAMQIVFPLVNQKLTEALQNALVNAAEPSKILSLIVGQIDLSNGLGKIAELLCEQVVHTILFILILILSILILKLLGKLVGKITELPIIKTCDGFLGFIYGLLFALALLFILVKLGLKFKPEIVAKYREGTYILNWLISL